MGQSSVLSDRKGDIIRYTACGYHCFDQCVLKVRIRDGVIVSIEPDDTVNPGMARDGEHSPGHLVNPAMIQHRPCPKGYAMAREIYDPNRVKYPMKRVGKRGEAKFERISWDEALDTITSRLVEIRDKYGPYSIFHDTYSWFGVCSFPLSPWFGAGVAGWSAHSCDGWEGPEKWVLGKDYDEMVRTGWLETIQDELNPLRANLIVLWGLNPTSTQSSKTNYNLLQAKERGIPIICIEPRYTMSAEVLADQWIPIRPTTDVAMMIAMTNVWFKEDLCDKEFIAKYVEPEGLERWKTYVSGTEDGIDKTPKWAEGICGVPADTIAAFARLYARSKPVNLMVSLSIGRQFYGQNPARASMYLQALTGNTCISGGTAPGETGLWQAQPVGPMPAVDWQQKPGWYTAPTLMEMVKWSKAIDLREKLDKGKIRSAEYNAMIGNVAWKPAPNIKMVIAESNNHVNNVPSMNQSIRAMKKLDFSVVFSQFAEMPTARYADILLPQMHTAFEGRNGGCSWPWSLFTLGPVNMGSYFVYRQKCIDPPGEVKPNDWVWTQIAKRLGIAELFNPRMAKVPDGEWEETIEQLYKEAYNNWAKMPEIAPLQPPSWEEFQKKPIFRFPNRKDPYYPFSRDIESGQNPFRGTESGKIELYSKELARGPEYLAMNYAPHAGGRCYGGGNLPAMAEMTKGGKGTFYSKDTKKYPLLMSSPHAFYRMHSFLYNNPVLRGDCYRHAVWLSVADAKARGIKDDELVRVHNDIGEMVIPAYVTSRVVPGTVAVHHGGWYQPGEEKTKLMPDGIDRGGAPNLLCHDDDLPDTIVEALPCTGLVQIEKWEGVR